MPRIQLLETLDVIIRGLEVGVDKLNVLLGRVLWTDIVGTSVKPQGKTRVQLLLWTISMHHVQVVVHDGILVVVAVWKVLSLIPGRTYEVTTRIEVVNGIVVLDVAEAVKSGDA